MKVGEAMHIIFTFVQEVSFCTQPLTFLSIPASGKQEAFSECQDPLQSALDVKQCPERGVTSGVSEL